MISILNFLLEASLCLFGFFALYFLLFRKDNQLNFRRFYILSAVGVSLLVPLIEFETPLVWLENTGQTAVGTVEPDGGQLFTMPEITILAREEGEKAGTDLWLYVISLSFIAFSSVILFRFLRQVFFVLRIRFDRRFHRIKEKDHTVVYTRGLLPTFSFLKTVFINEAEIKEEGELSQILLHELAHVRQYHSLDNIFFEIVSALMWFHPVVWYFKHEVRAVHEYLADREATATHDPEMYSSLLSRMALMSYGLSVGNYFNKSQTLMRIKMLSLNNKRKYRLKTLFYVPLVILMFIAFSCNKEIIAELDAMHETMTQAEMTPEVKKQYDLLKASNPDLNFSYVEVSEDNKDRIMTFRNQDNQTFAKVFMFPERETIGIILSETANFKHAMAAVQNDEVFIITEKPASPPGGFPGFYEYVAGFMVYPQQARKAGIEGRVYVQFIVDEEGYLTDVKAVKGIGGGCDAEAVNIVAAAPRWEPASQRGITVKQRIVLPITFSLGSEKVLKPQGALEPSVEENEILAIVDEPATPTEGYDKYFDYLRNSLVYPEAAREKGIEGKVFVQFVVDEEGTLTDVKVVQGIDDGCDSEAVRVVAASARWNIPRHQGVAVKQRIVLPISFKIN